MDKGQGILEMLGVQFIAEDGEYRNLSDILNEAKMALDSLMDSDILEDQLKLDTVHIQLLDLSNDLEELEEQLYK